MNILPENMYVAQKKQNTYIIHIPFFCLTRNFSVLRFSTEKPSEFLMGSDEMKKIQTTTTLTKKENIIELQNCVICIILFCH